MVTKQATLDTDLTLTPVRSPTAPETGVTLAIMYAFVLLVIPSDVVIVEVGAAAFPAGLLGMFGFGLWVGASASLSASCGSRHWPGTSRWP